MRNSRGEVGAHAKLAALLWGDSPDEQARGSLRKVLTHLRTQLGADSLRADRDIVQFNSSQPVWVDA
jgi:DNA-binding SARP family transcriptional activator